jgi:hypothetical protein
MVGTTDETHSVLKDTGRVRCEAESVHRGRRTAAADGPGANQDGRRRSRAATWPLASDPGCGQKSK